MDPMTFSLWSHAVDEEERKNLAGGGIQISQPGGERGFDCGLRAEWLARVGLHL